MYHQTQQHRGCTFLLPFSHWSITELVSEWRLQCEEERRPVESGVEQGQPEAAARALGPSLVEQRSLDSPPLGVLLGLFRLGLPRPLQHALPHQLFGDDARVLDLGTVPESEAFKWESDIQRSTIVTGVLDMQNAV